MAEIAVSFAIEQLLPLLTSEIKLLKGVHKDFAYIKDELESIQAFLKDADRRAAADGDSTSEGAKTWVKQVREVAFRIEDIIDDYMIQVGQQPRDPGCVSFLHKITHLIKTMIPCREIASEIQDIKSSVFEIKERSERYGFQIQPCFLQGASSFRGSQNAKWHNHQMAALYIDENDIVGFQASKKILIDCLVEGRAERTVISVVAMGGQGKTTLAKNVFDSKEVVGHFQCRVWITVSESYSVEGLLSGMLKELYKQNCKSPAQDISKMDRGSLISELRNYLQHKRYVFVFDDVWNICFWDEIEYAVIDNKNGSKIFITTRNMDVATYCKRSSFIEVHELETLTEGQSFALLKKKAFQFDSNGCCPKELIDISFEIAKKCKGLPLAIVAIGGLLSTKEKSVFEWKRFSENMTLELKKDAHLSRIKKLLGFSYNDLPFYLKSCLLYFGIYPEDYKVESKRLIRQWVAEGFVKEEMGYTLEEVAERYLTELIHRSLVQVSSIRIDGKIKTCCVHDLVRMMILEKCEDLSFCAHNSEDNHSSLLRIIRRLSITTNCNDITECIENSHIRSLFIFLNESQFFEEYFVRRILKEYMRLKVLDFEGSNVLILENIGNFNHLKYLCFKNSFQGLRRHELPKSIGMLQNLETLDLRGSNSFYEMPMEITRLRKLRHLLAYRMSLLRLKGCIGRMESLQTLTDVEIFEDGIELIRELGKLGKLRKLGLSHIRREHGSALSSLLSELPHLEELRSGKRLYHFESDVIDLHLVSSPPMLRNLKLHVKLENFSEWILKFQNLVELSLSSSKLTDDPIKSLEKLQNLLSLSINDAYEGESLHFYDVGFQNLKELHIRNLPNLNSIIIDKGALQSLKRFKLCSIPKLETFPAGIQHLEKLEVLNVQYVPHVERYPKL